MSGTVYLATDHAGFDLKNAVLSDLQTVPDLTVIDCGATTYDEGDDYPDLIARAAAKVSKEPTARAIIFGASGQGEAMVANRFPHVRAAVYYGAPPRSQTDADGASLSLLESTRLHNDANVLSLGARFLTEPEAIEAVHAWLGTAFVNTERHVRRIKKVEHVQEQ